MNNWYKKADLDFASVDVRRMKGILKNFNALSHDALAEMNKWLINGEDKITMEEATTRLSYYLERMGLK